MAIISNAILYDINVCRMSLTSHGVSLLLGRDRLLLLRLVSKPFHNDPIRRDKTSLSGSDDNEQIIWTNLNVQT